jgi:hypothetical protein
MVFFVCCCGFSVTRFVEVASKKLCSECGSGLLESVDLPLNVFRYRRRVVELDENSLSITRKLVFDVIKQHPNGVSDREIVKLTGLLINQVTGRRNDLCSAGIPLVKAVGKNEDNVTLWGLARGV